MKRWKATSNGSPADPSWWRPPRHWRLSALPVLIGDNDAVVIDQFAHASLHMAVELLRVTIVSVNHNDIAEIDRHAEALSLTHDRVWYIADGLYSMFGDFASFGEIDALLQRHPKLHVYADDAHSAGWYGKYGRGCVLTHLGHHERVVVALSMAKAFASVGGILALPTKELKTRIRLCGGPMLFSGPIQPPMLGVSLAVSALLLTPEHERLQAALISESTARPRPARRMEFRSRRMPAHRSSSCKRVHYREPSPR